LYNAAEEL